LVGSRAWLSGRLRWLRLSDNLAPCLLLLGLLLRLLLRLLLCFLLRLLLWFLLRLLLLPKLHELRLLLLLPLPLSLPLLLLRGSGIVDCWSGVR